MSENDKDTTPKPLEGPYFYDADKNPEFIKRGENEDKTPRLVANPEYIAFMGVPNRDISAAEFAGMPRHIQERIDTSPIHRKTKPRPPAPAAKAETKPAEPAKE